MSSPQVVIVGAGPVGLSLAIELGMRQIRCLIIERNERVGHAPRAKTTNVRTRTHLRRWGIAKTLADASPFGVDYPSDVVFVTQLGGELLASIPNAFNCDPTRSSLYPEHGQWVPQYILERVLKAHAETLPTVEFRFSTEFTSAEQTTDRIALRLNDTRHSLQQDIECSYLIGADGARSVVRELIGAKMSGQYGLSRNYNIVFRAPGLAQAHRHGQGAMYWQVNPRGPSLIGPMDKNDIWFFMPTKLQGAERLSDEQAAALIRQATGIDLPYEILSRDEWTASRLIADKYRSGRIFLAGDACHLHPPFGGYGMNMGVADAVDIGWKIAATLEGWGGEGLLESYEAERRPIHEKVMAEAVANHAVLSNEFWAEGLEEQTPQGENLRREIGSRIMQTKVREFHTLGTVLGQCYQNSPVILSGGESPCPFNSQVYRPSAAPGCLAPHAWMRNGSSLYDHFGTGFTLVSGPNVSSRQVSQACAHAASLKIPLTLIERVENDGLDLYDADLTLIRPDQYVAWRGTILNQDIIRRVTGSNTLQSEG